MLGFEVAQSTISKYMVRGGTPASQSWKTFLRNHADAIAAINVCVVKTLTFERFFAFLVLGHGRQQLLWFEVTRRPTAERLARQIRASTSRSISNRVRASTFATFLTGESRMNIPPRAKLSREEPEAGKLHIRVCEG
jgi:hypothetical protein